MAVTLHAAGTYTVRPRYQAVKAALLRTGPRDAVRQSLATLVLVEIEVRDAPEPPDLGRWHQERLDQVPWDEVYTTLDRSIVIARMYKVPVELNYAVSFYLHLFDPARRLETPWGSLALKTPQEERPPHLSGRVYHDPGWLYESNARRIVSIWRYRL